jgi:hypothetical protein
LSAIALLVAAPAANDSTSPGKITEPVVVPQPAGAVEAAPGGAALIPGSLTTAVMPSSPVARIATAKKTAPKDPAGTTAGSATAAAAPGNPGGGSSAPSGPITAGNSKANCVSPDFPGGVLSPSIISGISRATGVAYNCLNTFANPMPAWSDWEQPWMFSTPSDGWDAWLAASPSHQAIMGMDLIPQSVSDNGNPLSWEQPCANGDYDQYATTLAENLVSYGAGSIVIRLGIEANGSWEADYVGTTSAEMSAWAKCYGNEVTAMRAVSGTHFLFVWNPNICTADIPLSKWYPGNSAVDIIGADAYDKDCGTLKTVAQEGWQAYSADSSSGNSSDPGFPSLASIESFAAANGKPLSFPEWGLGTGDDDPAYVTDMGKMFKADDFAFESYFDSNDDGIAPLGSSIPQATAAYGPAFS